MKSTAFTQIFISLMGLLLLLPIQGHTQSICGELFEASSDQGSGVVQDLYAQVLAAIHQRDPSGHNLRLAEVQAAQSSDRSWTDIRRNPFALMESHVATVDVFAKYNTKVLKQSEQLIGEFRELLNEYIVAHFDTQGQRLSDAEFSTILNMLPRYEAKALADHANGDVQQEARAVKFGMKSLLKTISDVAHDVDPMHASWGKGNNIPSSLQELVSKVAFRSQFSGYENHSLMYDDGRPHAPEVLRRRPGDG